MGLIRFIIYGNVLISLSAGMLSLGLVSFLGLNKATLYFFSVFFATLFIYNFQRIPRLDEVNDEFSDRHIWLKKNKTILYLLIIVGLVGSIITYFQFLTVQNDLLFLVLIGVVGILYAIKTIKGKALRDFPYLKIHLIALTWILVVIVWPLIREEIIILNQLALIVGLYLIMVAITIPFDVRDLSYDDLKKKTTPQVIGIKWSKIVAVVLLSTGYALFVIHAFSLLKNPFFYISFIGFFILIINSNTKRKEMYFSGLIDGWILFLGIMFLFTNGL